MAQRVPHLFVAPSEVDGLGVFTGSLIPKGSLIEICPVLVIPKKEMKLIKRTILYHYYFEWKKDKKSGALALGYGSLYNHSYKPNARYEVDFKEKVMYIFARKNIKAGMEIFINYNGDPKDKSVVWFEK